MVLVSASITLAKVIDGQQGIPGEKGADGKTSYLHIKYSDDGQTFTENNGETLGAYIGTLVNFTEADSTNFADYTWKKFTEDVDEELESIRKTIVDSSTSILETSEEITLNALKSYITNEVFEQLQSTVEAQFKLMADKASLSFIESNITDINTALEKINGDLSKHFDFTLQDGLIIKAGENSVKLRLDNDFAGFYDGEVDEEDLSKNRYTSMDKDSLKTGNLYVGMEEIAQFGNYAFLPFENTDDGESVDGLDFTRVGG